MNKLILICLMGLCAVMAAPTQDEQEVADMMNAGLKLMAKEGRLGELSDDMEIQMLDLKQCAALPVLLVDKPWTNYATCSPDGKKSCATEQKLWDHQPALCSVV